jgi:hypothetical protein
MLYLHGPTPKIQPEYIEAFSHLRKNYEKKISMQSGVIQPRVVKHMNKWPIHMKIP